MPRCGISIAEIDPVERGPAKCGHQLMGQRTVLEDARATLGEKCDDRCLSQFGNRIGPRVDEPVVAKRGEELRNWIRRKWNDPLRGLRHDSRA